MRTTLRISLKKNPILLPFTFLIIKILTILVKDHILLSKDNVVFTPHIAFYSQEALERILETTVQNIQGFISGKLENIL